MFSGNNPKSFLLSRECISEHEKTPQKSKLNKADQIKDERSNGVAM